MTNKALLCIFFIFAMHASEDHKHHPKPIRRSPEMEFNNNEVHLTIEVPDRPANPSPRTPSEIKALKIKLVAITAILTAIITGGFSSLITWLKCRE